MNSTNSDENRERWGFHASRDSFGLLFTENSHGLLSYETDAVDGRDVFSPTVHQLTPENDGSSCIHSVGLHTYILSLLGVRSECCVTVLTVEDYANQPTPLLFLASLSFASASRLRPLGYKLLNNSFASAISLPSVLKLIERLSPLSSRHWSRPLSSHRWALFVHHQFLWEGTQQVGLWFAWNTEVMWHSICPLSSVGSI